MFRSSLAVVLLAVASVGAHASQVTITTPFINLENRNFNSLGFLVGQYLRIGANSVTPNGLNGTTGVAALSGTSFQTNIYYLPGPLIQNFFSRSLSITTQQLAAGSPIFNPWTLSFTNGENSSQAIVQLQSGAQIAHFVQTITLSGSSARPTFTWTPPPAPPGTSIVPTVNGYRINIYDKALINNNPAQGPVNNGAVASVNLSPNITTYTVNENDFTVKNHSFELGKSYSIEISMIQTRDGSSLNLGNSNLQSIARTYADFTPLAGGAPVVNLPVVLANGSFKFNMTVVAGQTYFIDPVVAIGYDYAIVLGDPNFQSVLLPADIGDGLYDIFGYNNLNQVVLLAHDWAAGVAFDFGAGGVDWFRVAGIETSAGLNPANTTAFITGLTFVSAGNFTGTQTPLLQNVPEPATLALVGLALAGIAATRRRKV